MIYIFYTDKFETDNLVLADKYSDSGYLVQSQLITGSEDLLYYWQGIGLHNNYFNDGSKPYGDKYYYNPLAVIIIADGAIGAFSTTIGAFYTTDIIPPDSSEHNYAISNLSGKNVKNLWLAICHSAEFQSGQTVSVATEFIRSNRIDNTYAYDGTLVTVELNGVFTFYTVDDKSIERLGLVRYLDDTVYSDVYDDDVHDLPGTISFSGFWFIMFNSNSFDPIEDYVIG